MGSPRSRPAANWVRWLSNGWPDRWPLTQLARRLCRLGIHGRVDPLEHRCHGLAVLVAGEAHGVAQQVHDTGLTWAWGKTASMAWGKPFRPSTTVIKMSCTPRLSRSFGTLAQNLAPSLAWNHSPRTSRGGRGISDHLLSWID